MEESKQKQEFESIHNEIKDKDAIIMNDEILNNKEDDNDFKNRNKQYTELIKNYSQSFKERQDVKKNLKYKFFYFVMISYVIVLISSIGILIAVLCVTPNSIPLIIGSAGTLITSIIGIPTIIANNLFPKDEDSNIVEMTKEMFKFDRNYYSNIENAKNNANKGSKKDAVK